MSDETDRSAVRDRIVEVAARLLADHGQAAVTTRGVAQRAGVQAPTIYRLFGDKDGLLDAVAEHVMTGFTATKASALARAADDDPVADLRRGWEMTIEFGLANPYLFVLLADPVRGRSSAAAQAGIRLLAERVHRVALAGRLRVSEERTVELIHAAGTGAVLAILARPEGQRDRTLANLLFDTLLDRILTPAPPSLEAVMSSIASHAISLRAYTAELAPLSNGERTLLAEWLDRIVDRG